MQKTLLGETVRSGFFSLLANRMFINVAIGLLGVFMPIFLFIYFDESLQKVALYYICIHIPYVILLPIGGKFLNKIGFRNALRSSVFFGITMYSAFYFLDKTQDFYLIPIALLSIITYKLLYWTPFHTDLAKFTDPKNRSKQIGFFTTLLDIIRALMPLVAGFLIANFSYSILFVIAVILYALAIIPLITIPKTNEYFSWTIKETWQKLFSKKYRKTNFAFMANGAEDAIGVVIWPIFIYQLLEGNFLGIGVLSSVIVITTIFLQLLVSHYSDKKGAHVFIKYSSILYALGWILKVFIATAFQIFIFDAYQKLMKVFMKIPFDALSCEIAADQGHFIDEFTVIKEMALNIGCALMYICVIILAFFVSVQFTFILAALAALSLNFIRAYKSS